MPTHEHFPGSRQEGGHRSLDNAVLAHRAGLSPVLVVAHAGTIRAALADSGASMPTESALALGAELELPL
jgi:broad specificity phosphatase PhoE